MNNGFCLPVQHLIVPGMQERLHQAWMLWCIVYEGVQNMPSQNMPLRLPDYLKLRHLRKSRWRTGLFYLKTGPTVSHKVGPSLHQEETSLGTRHWNMNKPTSWNNLYLQLVPLECFHHSLQFTASGALETSSPLSCCFSTNVPLFV